MNRIKTIILSAVAVFGMVALPLAVVPTADAQPVKNIQDGVNSVGGDDSQPELEDGIKTIVNVILFILGAIAVIMIIIGGIRYTTSNGDAGSIKGAKDTILYAVVGLIVAILAYAIVNFVLGAFS